MTSEFNVIMKKTLAPDEIPIGTNGVTASAKEEPGLRFVVFENGTGAYCYSDELEYTLTARH